jgi:hypothetical protein
MLICVVPMPVCSTGTKNKRKEILHLPKNKDFTLNSRVLSDDKYISAPRPKLSRRSAGTSLMGVSRSTNQ